MPLTIQAIDADVLVCDSREIAKELEIKHDNFMQTIETHKAVIESHFGHLLFQTGTVTNSVKATNRVKYCLLAEDQFIFIATLSRNTVKVVEVKAQLVKAFSTARRALQSPFQASLSITQTDKNYMQNVLKQFTQCTISQLKQVKNLDELNTVFANGLKFVKDYEQVQAQYAALQQAETNLALNYCFDDGGKK